MKLLILILLTIYSSATCIADENSNNLFIQNKVKSRAKRDITNRGRSKYIYINDHSRESVHSLRFLQNSTNIGNVFIERNSTIREISIYINLEKEIQIKNNSSITDIGNVFIAPGNRVREIKSYINLKKGLKVR